MQHVSKSVIIKDKEGYGEVNIFNLDEPKSVAAEDRKKEDKAAIGNLIRGADNKGWNYRIKAYYRLGNRSMDKTRPLLVVLANMEERDAFVSNMIESYCKIDLAQGGDADLAVDDRRKKLGFAKDRSKEDRLEHKSLLEKLRKKEAEGETGFRIRRGNLVKVPFRGGPRTGATQQ